MPLSSMNGLIITGTRPRCGKTVVTAGLAAALRLEGIEVQALKPLEFAPPAALTRRQEQTFMNQLTRITPRTQPVQAISPHEVTPVMWNLLVSQCRRSPCPLLLESPGSVASPLCFGEEGVMDVTDFAKALGIPVLLVTGKHAALIDELTPALSYLQQAGVLVAGWLAVETQPAETPDWDIEAMLLSQRFRIHYLGHLPYTPHLSVEAMRADDLVGLVSRGIDLLPIQKALNLTLL